MPELKLSVVDLAAKSGGMASGLEAAGFQHRLLVEADADARSTLKLNRPHWNVIDQALGKVDFAAVAPVDLVTASSGYLPSDGEGADPLPDVVAAVATLNPEAVLVDAPRGLAAARFAGYRAGIARSFAAIGYQTEWKQLQLSEFGVPQRRQLYVLLAMRAKYSESFSWPGPQRESTVGRAVYALMGSRGWEGALLWASKATGVAPTIVASARGTGGADLGPERYREEWQTFGIDARGIADDAPDASARPWHVPRLTNAMVARLQGFGPDWVFAGKKTSVYRQIGTDFPPAVATALGIAIAEVLTNHNVIRPEFGDRLPVQEGTAPIAYPLRIVNQ